MRKRPPGKGQLTDASARTGGADERCTGLNFSEGNVAFQGNPEVPRDATRVSRRARICSIERAARSQEHKMAVEKTMASTSLAEVVDRILDKGVVIDAWVRCVGPLPPYSFAMLGITQPSYAAVDAARQMLNIGLSATIEEIKGVYHRRLHQIHPDHQGAAQDA